MCCALAAAVSFSGLLFRGGPRLRIFIALPALAAGFIWSWAYTGLFVERPAARFHDDITTVTAVVQNYPVPRARGHYAEIRVRQAGRPDVGARLYYYRDLTLEPGDIIEFLAWFERTDGMEDGERIDALSSRGHFLTARLLSGVSRVGSEGRFWYFPQRLANTVANMVDELFPGDVAPFMRALITGKQDRLRADSALSSALSGSGIVHVVAVSGMHISFLMGFIGVFVRNKRFFALVGIPVLFIYMAMTGFTPSVSRAGIMQILLICAPLFRCESDSITSISAALLVLLALNPYSCASVGLQLSFSATLGIILFTGRLNSALTGVLRRNIMRGRPDQKRPRGKTAPAEDKLTVPKLRLTVLQNRKTARSRHKIPVFVMRVLVSNLATTIGALVFTLPLTALHFGYVSLISPLTNLLTLWAVSFAFPLGIIACALGFIFLPVGAAAAFPVTLAVRYITGTARTLAAVPFSAVYVSNTLIVIWLVYVYAMAVTLAAFKAKARQRLIPACLAAISLCAVFLLTYGDDGSSVIVLNVGQGQSVVITSGEYTAVIDCGSISGENAGEIAHEFLLSQGRTVIDILILTHFHEDHVSGVEYLLSRAGVSALAIPDPEGSYIAEDIIELARRRGADIIYVTETLMASLGGTNLMLYPPLGDAGRSENELGLSVLHLGGSLRSLITGDMEAAVERRLLRFADIPEVDLLVVGHHGSRFSTSEELLRALRPSLAVISVGENSYGHPAEETLERLGQYSVEVLRTDIIGHVTVSG